MNKKHFPLILLLTFPYCGFAEDNSVMFHCQINKEWIDLSINNEGVTHYEHSKNNVIDLALDNQKNANLFKMSSISLIGGGEAHIKFTNGVYDYYLYDITAHIGEEYIFKSGVAVLRDGVVLSNRECINDATILSDAYERLPRFDQDPISFVQDEVYFYK